MNAETQSELIRALNWALKQILKSGNHDEIDAEVFDHCKEVLSEANAALALAGGGK